MMKIDNFERLKPYFIFEDENDFYYIQIIQRRKDNPDINKSEKLIKTYHIRSLEYLDRKKDQIIQLCKFFNARAYFWINRRNYKDLAYRTNKLLADYLYSGHYQSIDRIFDRVTGKYHSDPDKKWIIDIDTTDESVLNLVGLGICLCQPVDKIKILDEISTKNGFHIISRPFNKKQLFDWLKEDQIGPVDIHKDNPTILYSL